MYGLVLALLLTEPPGDEGAPVSTPKSRSATHLGNSVLIRSPKRPTYAIGAAVRMGVLLGDGAKVVQRFGYGFAAKLRIHFVGAGLFRFGFDFHGGHTRFQQRKEFDVLDSDGNVDQQRRFILLTHTDFSIGPSFEITAGPTFVLLSGGGGVAISTFDRPIDHDPVNDEHLDSVDGLVRGGVALAVPIRNNHGIAIGVDLHKIFSNASLVADTDAPPETPPDTQPFDFLLLSYLSYQAWF